MPHNRLFPHRLALFLASSTVAIGHAFLPPPAAGQTASRNRLNAAVARLPLHFEENAGQADERVKFLARGRGYTVFLTPSETVVSLTSGVSERAILRMKLAGANADPAVDGREKLPGVVNYFVGSDSTAWRTHVPTYAQVHYADVYPGVDLIYYGNQQQLEYDLVVSPGTDPRAIALDLEGANSADVDENGDLVLRTAAGDVRMRKPLVYQETDGRRTAIAGAYEIGDSPLPTSTTRRVTLRVGDYDARRPLVIDPVLVLDYSTLLGGSVPAGNAFTSAGGIAVDASGSAYVVGATNAADFPVLNALQPTKRGATDAFIAKLDATGSALVYATYFGGSTRSPGGGIEFSGPPTTSGTAIGIDPQGQAYITGSTSAIDLPMIGGFQPSHGGGAFNAFVAKLDRTGSGLLYSTYIGGTSADSGADIAVGPAGHVYVAGGAESANFPTRNPLQATRSGSEDAFVAHIDTTASGLASLVYSTLLGGPGFDTAAGIALDAQGNVYVTGIASAGFPTVNGLALAGGSFDAYVAKLDATGSTLLYSTVIGGALSDTGADIAVDGSGNAYVTGRTTSRDFPTRNAFQPARSGFQDAFLTKVNTLASGDASLVFSTYLGGSGTEEATALALGADGSATVLGVTGSDDFPTLDELPFPNGGTFVTRIGSTGALIYSTRFGADDSVRGEGIAVDGAGTSYITGEVFVAASGTTFPVTPGAFQTQVADDSTVAFVTKISVRTDFLISTLSPNRGGDTGNTSVIVRGNGFVSGASVRLVKAGKPDIVGTVRFVSTNVLSVNFDLHGAARDTYDVVLTNPDGSSTTVRAGYVVQAGEAPHLWVEVLGLHAVSNTGESPFTILYGNSGNTDAHGVLLSIAGIPKTARVRLGFTLRATPLTPDLEQFRSDSISPISESDTEKNIELFVGVVPAGFTGSLKIFISPRLPSTGPRDFRLTAKMSAPFFGSPATADGIKCAAAISNLFVQAAFAFSVPLRCEAAMGSIALNVVSAIVSDGQNVYNGNIDSNAVYSGVGVFSTAAEAMLACSLTAAELAESELIIPAVLFGLVSSASSLIPAIEACTGTALADTGSLAVGATDPNDKVGANGVLAQRFISGEEPLRYGVFFENLGTATAPAQEVVITDQLDPVTMDLTTFSLGSIAFGNTEVFPVLGDKAFTTDVDLRPAKNLIVHINAELNDTTGLLTYRLTSRDPATGQLPTDPLVGFLPPNVNAPEGDGGVVFTVMPRPGLPTGTDIRNTARIVFDRNDPIDTPAWFNTIDNASPVSVVGQLPPTTSTQNFLVQWAGADIGAGVRDFTVYVSEDGAPFAPLVEHDPNGSAVVSGQVGKTYSFFSVARDLTGNGEPAKTSAEATTTVASDATPPAIDPPLAASGTIVSIAPAGTSAGQPVYITGAGFDGDATNNLVSFTPASGPAITVFASTVQTLDAASGFRRLTAIVPVGLGGGTATVRVINRTTNRITAARSLDVVPLIVAAMPPLAPAATAIPIRIVGSRNGQFAAASRVVLGPGVTVRTMTVESATSIVATVDVAPSAPIGPRDVVVVSPKQRAVAIGAVSVDR